MLLSYETYGLDTKRHAQQRWDARSVRLQTITHKQPPSVPHVPAGTAPHGERRASQARAHLEAARQLYNAMLSLGQRRLRRMRADPAWQESRSLSRAHKAERAERRVISSTSN